MWLWTLLGRLLGRRRTAATPRILRRKRLAGHTACQRALDRYDVLEACRLIDPAPLLLRPGQRVRYCTVRQRAKVDRPLFCRHPDARGSVAGTVEECTILVEAKDTVPALFEGGVGFRGRAHTHDGRPTGPGHPAVQGRPVH